jgi:hypothetical protein
LYQCSQKEELAKFLHSVIRPQLAEFSEKLDKIRQHEVDVVEEEIEKKENECEEFNSKQKMYQKETMLAQEDVNRQLVEGAKLHAVGAFGDARTNYRKKLTSMSAVLW